ncbi:MAG: tRNA preQ1(34) S-adenosylmethionine ribosyltransferase-isomerase QueA [Planctomycetota bacterium]
METAKLSYDLPPELIAQYPAESRSQSRLLVLDRGKDALADSCFAEIAGFLEPGDCLVLNDTRVIPAKFFAHRRSGGAIQGLFLASTPDGLWEVMLRNARRLKEGRQILLHCREGKNTYEATVCRRLGEGRWLLKIHSDEQAHNILEDIGFMPLPPYIKRTDNVKADEMDQKRYQTVFARRPGAVAAPTAGLHFTGELIEQLRKFGVKIAYITLHVGEGTFKPVTARRLDEHEMHSEWYSIDEETAGVINSVKQKGRRIIAVGTTSVRTLESVADNGKVCACEGATSLFIRPGYQFKIVDAIITNFHLPRSTLLALVAAFAGLERVMQAYKHAIEKRYRFYSYGDAMLIV